MHVDDTSPVGSPDAGNFRFGRRRANRDDDGISPVLGGILSDEFPFQPDFNAKAFHVPDECLSQFPPTLPVWGRLCGEELPS